MKGADAGLSCRVMFLLSYLAAITAILLLWFVYPKVFDYSKATQDSLLFLDAMKVGHPCTPILRWDPAREAALCAAEAPLTAMLKVCSLSILTSKEQKPVQTPAHRVPAAYCMWACRWATCL